MRRDLKQFTIKLCSVLCLYVTKSYMKTKRIFPIRASVITIIINDQ